MIVLHITVFIIVLIIISGIWLSKKEYEEKVQADEQFRQILREHGMNYNQSNVGLWESRGEIPGVCNAELIVNRIEGNKCLGKDWYYCEDNKWQFYTFCDANWVWKDYLRRHNISPEQGERYIRGYGYRSKDELIADRFEDDWFLGYDNTKEYFKSLKEK